jgi:hypothetical protein
MTYDIHASVHETGIATGASDIRTDTMTFRYKGETFTFPSSVVWPFARYNGYFYEAAIDDLRKLEAELAGG